MNVINSTLSPSAPIPEPTVLTDYGFSAEDASRITDVTGVCGSELALLTYSKTRDVNSSAGFTARAYLVAAPLQEISDVSHFFSSAFEHIQQGGFLICRLETSELRKQRLLRELPQGIRYFYYTGDYLIHRVCSRVVLTRSLYRKLFTSLRTISKAEVIGRLYHAGYTVNDVFDSQGSLIVIAQKSAPENIKRPASSEGVLLKMWRIGKAGTPFSVYKFRTMHPYSEYVQEYLNQTSGLETSGKFKNDFRITTPGKWMRKFWIDEIPMVVNLVKGDLKLVGVRPLSKQYFSLYPKELQQERILHKPGLLPPYYADLPTNFGEILESEHKYLQAYSKAPLKTDLIYLVKISYNILWKQARSK